MWKETLTTFHGYHLPLGLSHDSLTLSTHEAEALATYLAQKEGVTPDETAWLSAINGFGGFVSVNPVLQGCAWLCDARGQTNSSHLRDALVAVAVKLAELVFEGSATFASVFDDYFSDCDEIAKLPSSEVVKYTLKKTSSAFGQ